MLVQYIAMLLLLFYHCSRHFVYLKNFESKIARRREFLLQSLYCWRAAILSWWWWCAIKGLSLRFHFIKATYLLSISFLFHPIVRSMVAFGIDYYYYIPWCIRVSFIIVKHRHVMLIRPNFRELMENSPAAIPLVFFLFMSFSVSCFKSPSHWQHRSSRHKEQTGRSLQHI